MTEPEDDWMPPDPGGLRAAVEEAIVAPPFDELRQAAAGRRRRRRSWLAGVATVVVIGGGATLALPSDNPLDPGRPDVESPYLPHIYDVNFFSSADGYLLMGDCPTPGDEDPGRPCRKRLYATGDSGETWTLASELPVDLGVTSDMTPSWSYALTLIPGDSGRLAVLIDEALPGQASDLPGSLLRSYDGGKTWEEPTPLTVADIPEPPVRAVPMRALADMTCSGDCPAVVSWLDVGRGEWIPLPTQPPMPAGDLPQLAMSPAGQGQDIYVAGPSAVTDDAVIVASSTDAGRTWRTSELPLDSPAPAVEVMPQVAVVAGGDSGAYVGVRSFTDGVDTHHRLFRTPDGGQTWTDVTAAGVDLQYLPLAASGDQVLTVAADVFEGGPEATHYGLGEVWASDDGGATWAPVPDLQDCVVSVRPSGQVYAQTADGLYASLDGGRTWSFSLLPAE